MKTKVDIINIQVHEQSPAVLPDSLAAAAANFTIILLFLLFEVFASKNPEILPFQHYQH